MQSMIDKLMQGQNLDYYKGLTAGGKFSVELNQEESAVILKIHDYGVDQLSDEEKQLLYRVIGKLKDEVWP